jgi:SAM-dependent methyltransferase
MTPITIYTSKAEKYARFRWGYASQAVDAVFQIAGLSSVSTILDLGAGTGILTRQLMGRVKRILAVEPDPQMNRWITNELPCSVITACAEAVPLSAQTADAILVGQAVHWFNPIYARQEILRLLKPGGWLVLLKNVGTDPALNAALQVLNSPEYGIQIHPQLSSFEPKPVEYYYGHHAYQSLAFPISFEQDWPGFLGGLSSASFVPDENHPSFVKYACAARQVFDRFAIRGQMEMRGETQLIIGQVRD